MFEVNNKITKTMSLTSFWYFVNFERVSIIDFEQVNDR